MTVNWKDLEIGPSVDITDLKVGDIIAEVDGYNMAFSIVEEINSKGGNPIPEETNWYGINVKVLISSYPHQNDTVVHLGRNLDYPAYFPSLYRGIKRTTVNGGLI